MNYSNSQRDGVILYFTALLFGAYAGYTGGLTTVKTYIADHRDLVPPKRQLVAPQENRGRRYQTSPGESYQMDWGFVQVDTNTDASYKVACFAMICHHCGERYIEFFPNARQENLFIGMIHAFTYCILRSLADSDAFQSGRCAEHNGRPETLAIIN